MAQPTNPIGLFRTCHCLGVTRVFYVRKWNNKKIKRVGGKKRERGNIIIGVNDLEKKTHYPHGTTYYPRKTPPAVQPAAAESHSIARARAIALNRYLLSRLIIPPMIGGRWSETRSSRRTASGTKLYRSTLNCYCGT